MIHVLIVVLCVVSPAVLSAADDPKPPSFDARGMNGAKGTVTLIPEDWSGKGPVVEGLPGLERPVTWWKDTDGVAPGVAGCHLELEGEHGKPTGRLFGEACLDGVLLVESNPGQGVVHAHVNDVGHPDVFDCNLWCRGYGAKSGSCEPIKAEQPSCKERLHPATRVDSARCECTMEDPER